MSYLEKAAGVFDDIAKVHSYARTQSAILPPSSATESIHELLGLVTPMLEELRHTFPTAMAAVEQQREQVIAKIAQARTQGEQAKDMLAQMKPPAEIRLGFVPAAPVMPAGLTTSYATEMRDRFLPQPNDVVDDVVPAAWQDWTINAPHV